MLKDYTHIVIVLDNSSSMTSIAGSVKSGLSEFMKTQRELKGKVTISVYEFDSTVKHRCDFVSLENASSVLDVYQPNGFTAMNDGICRAIDETGKRLREMQDDERPQNVVVLVITDGEENASIYFRTKDVKEKVQHQKDKYNWQFTFLGTDIDAVTTGKSYGISVNTSVNFDKSDAGVRAALAMTSSKLSMYRGTGDAKSMEYSDADRAAIMPDSTGGINVQGSSADRSVGGSAKTGRDIFRGDIPSAV